MSRSHSFKRIRKKQRCNSLADFLLRLYHINFYFFQSFYQPARISRVFDRRSVSNILSLSRNSQLNQLHNNRRKNRQRNSNKNKNRILTISISRTKPKTPQKKLRNNRNHSNHHSHQSNISNIIIRNMTQLVRQNSFQFSSI